MGRAGNHRETNTRDKRDRNQGREEARSFPLLLLPVILALGILGGLLGRNAEPAKAPEPGTAGVLETENTGQSVGAESTSGGQQTEAAAPENSSLQVHFIDVGQGDATLIVCDGHAMLIDGGDNGQGTALQLYLEKQNVTALDYVVATHPDADHIGGLDVIITKFDCGTILMTDYEKDTATYRDVVDAISYRGYQKTTPVAGDTYALGSASFTIVGPEDLDGSANDSSVALVLQHGENRFYFEGDAEEEEQDILAAGIPLEADVFKLGHHGSRTSNSEEMVAAVNPDYAVISVGENSYGHPHGEVLNRLRQRGVQVFRTDEQGSIIAYSDGTQITWNCSPSESWQAGE